MKKFLLLLLVSMFLVSLVGCVISSDSTMTNTSETTDTTTTTSETTTTSTIDIVWPEYSVYNAVLYEVNIRNYTPEGTFAAFQEHLPRLKQLGVDILWLMPIHPISSIRRIGSLGSWYSVANYREVNPEFGTKADFTNLVEAAHALGFKVILDLVANHTGWDNPWIAAHKDWYTQDAQGNIIIPYGTNWNDVADLNYTKTALQAEMISVMKYWVTDFDIDGYRADYAGGVPTTFWETATTALEEIKPMFMLAEDNSQFALLNSAFDANYGFTLMSTINAIAAGTQKASSVRTLLTSNKTRYPSMTFPVQYTTNHDINAWEGSIPTLLGSAARVMNTLVFTAPGMPMIYSGQEINLDRSLAFFDKDQITWGNWETNATHLFYEKLVRLKKTNPALWHDDMTNIQFLHSTDSDVLCYVRQKGDNTVIVILNLAASSQTTTVTFNTLLGNYVEYFTEESTVLATSELYTLPGWSFRVYVNE